MKETLNTAVVAIAFLWVGLIVAPGAGPNSEILKIGLIGTASAVAGFAVIAYFKRGRQRSGTQRRI